MYQLNDERTGLELDFEDEFISRIFNLLHVTRGSEQKINSETGEAYYPYRKLIFLDGFQDHVRGIKTLAFNVIRKRRKANFIAFDIDANFYKRLPILKAALTDLGIAEAAFATNGSSLGKGKVIVTLSRPLPRQQAEKLRDDILVRADVLGLNSKDKVDVFPTSREGGLLRILGRNTARNGPIEVPMDLDGNISDLSYIKPLQIKADAIPTPKPKVSPWVVTTLKHGIPEDASHKVITKKVKDLARDAVRIKNGYLFKGEAWDLYCKWLAEVLHQSQWLQKKPDELKLFDPDSIESKRWFDYALNDTGSSWQPIKMLEGKNPKSHAKCFIRTFFPNQKKAGVAEYPYGEMPWLTATPETKMYSWGAGSVYRLLCKLINTELGLNRLAFSVDAERVGDYLGVSRQRASVMLKDAEKQGLIVTVKAGKKHTAGSPGYAPTYALVAIDETPEETLSKASEINK